ncbi:hypothetical protein KAX35_01885, partial [candidate division WOR-3 bacterium]|nr:hypothetical protein [candidate division WOR-3 bacterium]
MLKDCRWFLILVLAVGMLGLFPSASDGFDLLKKAKEKVEEKVEEKTEEEMDKILEGEEEEEKKEEQKTEASSDTVEDMTLYTKYDFVPGDKVIFYDDMSGEEVSEFPLRWRLDSGVYEVVKL